jgi:hypothetical protein
MALIPTRTSALKASLRAHFDRDALASVREPRPGDGTELNPFWK